MRSPAPCTSDARSSHGAENDTVSANQMPEDGARAAQFKTESDDEQDEQLELQRSPMPPQASSSARFAASAPSPPAAEPSIKRTWQTGGRQLLEQSRRRRSSLQQHLDTGSSGGERTLTADAASPARHTSAGDFAEEIESEAAEIRTLIARTAQLWSAVDRAERAEGLPPVPRSVPQQPQRSFSVSAIQTRSASLPEQYVCAEEEEDSTLSSDEEEDEEGDDTETESGGELALQPNSEYSVETSEFVESLRRSMSEGVLCIDRRTEQRMQVDEEAVDEGHASEDTEEEGDSIDQESGGLQLEQGEAMDASNRAINASKARAIKNAMLGNLIRLGFRENTTHAALEAGVLEIDHYDSDCELAYVDIFMSLVKMVCDAHVDVLNESGEIDQEWSSPGSMSGENEDEPGAMSSDENPSLEQRSFLPFKWPVFDMAQFEFGNARAGTCFNSVCVLTNLPKVSMDRTEELMEVLSCNLFCMIGDPIQVVIPSASSTGRTKGHAFLEFDDPDMAKRCASAVDGLTWGRGPFGRIRGNLFRQYQVKSPAEEQQRMYAAMNDRASHPGSFPGDLPAHRFQPAVDGGNAAHQRNLFCDSDDDSSDAGEWVVDRPIEYSQFDPSPLLDLSSDSVNMREQYESSQHAMHLDWDDEAFSGEYAMPMSSEEDEDDESFDSNSVLELQVPDEEDKAMDRSLFDELVRECAFHNGSCSPARVSLSSGEAQESSTVASTASAVAREALGECGMVEQAWEASHEGEDGAEKPWRRYCEELIVRNREMQEQVAFARRRIVQLSHNNQKLHLLIDRVERDRDGLLFENDLLQTQLHGYEDHEQDHDSLMKELVTLRKRLKQKEHLFDVRNLDSHQHVQAASSSTSSLNAGSSHLIQSAFAHLSPTALASSKMEDLKEWEQLLESALSRVRSAKEEKALEMQKKLDRQVEEQNELKLCVICLSNEKSILCLPCRHLCLCKTCSRRQEVAKCPICRLEIEEMLAVYSWEVTVLGYQKPSVDTGQRGSMQSRGYGAEKVKEALANADSIRLSADASAIHEREDVAQDRDKLNQCRNPFCQRFLRNSYASYCEDRVICQRYRALRLQCLANSKNTATTDVEALGRTDSFLVEEMRRSADDECEEKQDADAESTASYVIPRRKCPTNVPAAPIAPSVNSENCPADSALRREEIIREGGTTTGEVSSVGAPGTRKRKRPQLGPRHRLQRKSQKTQLREATRKPSIEPRRTEVTRRLGDRDERYGQLVARPCTESSSGVLRVPSDPPTSSVAAPLTSIARDNHRDPAFVTPPSLPVPSQNRGFSFMEDRPTGVSERHGSDSRPPCEYEPQRTFNHQQWLTSVEATSSQANHRTEYERTAAVVDAPQTPAFRLGYPNGNVAHRSLYERRQDAPLLPRPPAAQTRNLRRRDDALQGDAKPDSEPTFSFHESFMLPFLSQFIQALPDQLQPVMNVTKKPRKLRWYVEYIEKIQRSCNPYVKVDMQSTRVVVKVQHRVWLKLTGPSTVELLESAIRAMRDEALSWRALKAEVEQCLQLYRTRVGDSVDLSTVFRRAWNTLKSRAGAVTLPRQADYFYGARLHHWKFVVGNVEIGSGSHEDKRESFRLAARSAASFLLQLDDGQNDNRWRPPRVEQPSDSGDECEFLFERTVGDGPLIVGPPQTPATSGTRNSQDPQAAVQHGQDENDAIEVFSPSPVHESMLPLDDSDFSLLDFVDMPDVSSLVLEDLGATDTGAIVNAATPSTDELPIRQCRMCEIIRIRKPSSAGCRQCQLDVANTLSGSNPSVTATASSSEQPEARNSFTASTDDIVEAPASRSHAQEQPADTPSIAAPAASEAATTSTSQPAAKRLRRFFELLRLSGQ